MKVDEAIKLGLRETCKKPVAVFAVCFLLVSYLAHTLILKMESMSPYEMTVDFYMTTRPYIPEGEIVRINNYVIKQYAMKTYGGVEV
jgi:hypothetical protein